MIKHWRTVEYTDDGCTEYQCLVCKTTWEARTSPLHSHWRFCPVCGVKWLGPIPLDHERSEHALNKRRSRWGSDRQQALAKLCQPTWQVSFKNSFTDGWESDGAPFNGSAKLALSFVNRHKRSAPTHDRHQTLYRVELVSTGERFPLPK